MKPAIVLVALWTALLMVACGDSDKDCGGPGCGGAPTHDFPATVDAQRTAGVPPEGVSHFTLSFGGVVRSYRIYVPDLPQDHEVPLVVALHGGLGTGDQFAAASRFEAKAQAEGFIVVFPDGVDRTWNGGKCCGGAARKNIDDVGFLAALIEELSKKLPVDRERVFMTGHSNGGIMSFRFGCERPDLVRAIAPVAGSLEVRDCKPSATTSLLAIHGDADKNHPLEGGEGDRSIAGVPFVSMARSLELWSDGMECEANPQHSVVGAITSTVWVACRDGAKASFLVIAGADHPWPGGASGTTAVQGRTSTALDATAAVWSFFEKLD